MKDEHKKPPRSVNEIGIHIGYIREDLAEMKKTLESSMHNFASKEEVHTLRDDLNDVADDVEALKLFKTQQDTSFWNNTGKAVERSLIGLLAAGMIWVISQNAIQTQQISNTKQLLKDQQNIESSQQRQIDELKEQENGL